MARVLISIPDGFLRTLDLASELEFNSRSEFIREAVKDRIKKLSKESEQFKERIGRGY